MDIRRGEVPTPRPLGGPKKMVRPGQSDRVKELGSTAGPINTLDGPPLANTRRPPRTSFSSTDRTITGGSKRRQDYDGESSCGNRASKRPRPDIAPSSDTVRLSQDDAYEIESIATTTTSNDGRSKHKENTNRLRQNEFRNTAMGSPSSRRRRRKKKPPVGGERRSSDVTTRSSQLQRSMSPDELGNSSPPPVVSDLVPQKTYALAKSSRSVQAHPKPGSLPFEAAEHRRQNVPTEEISDDELANEGTKQGGRLKPQASSNSTKYRSTRLNPKMRLCQAVSGLHAFQPDYDVEVIRDGYGPVWKVVTGDGRTIGFPWLRLDAERMNKINHCPDSEIIVIHRPQTKTIPSILLLRFEHEKASRHFIREVGEVNETVKFEPKPVTFLTSAYERSLDTARQNCSGEHADTSVLEDDPKSAGSGAAPPYSDNETRRSQAISGHRASNTRLIDRLSARGNGRSSVSPPPSKPLATPRTRRATRQSAPGSPFADEDPFLPRWSLDNTAWKKDWDRELVYPSTGRNRATVHKEDIHRLDEGAFLNDSLVFCYLRYLQEEMERERPEIAKRIYFMNTYFFEILRKAKGWLINYEGVKSWTSKVDIFSYDYIVVPVNEEAHWYLAIICNPRVIIEANQAPDGEEVRRNPSSSPRTRRRSEVGPHSSPIASRKAHQKTENGQPEAAGKVDRKEFRIITLDSLGAPHSKTCQMLRKYLVEEAKNRKNFDPLELDRKIGLTAKNIPGQANFCDCGVFLLGYAQRFLEDPDGFVATILQRGKPEWTVDAPQLRNQIRETLFRLHKEYREELAQRKSKKRKRIGVRTQESLSAGTSTPASEAQDGAGSASDQRGPQSNPQITGGGDTPLSTPTREQASGKRSVKPGPDNRKAEGRTSPHTSPSPTAPVEKSKAAEPPQGEVQSKSDRDTPTTGQDTDRWEEEAKIRPSIEEDGGLSPSSRNMDSSSDLSSTRGQPDQTDDMVHSPPVSPPPDTGTYAATKSLPTLLKQDMETPEEFASGPRFIARLPSSPVSTTSAGNPIRGEISLPRNRDDEALEIEDNDDLPRASKRVKETDKVSRYFGPGDEQDYTFQERPKHDSRKFEVKSARERGRGRRSSDPVDLTDM